MNKFYKITLVLGVFCFVALTVYTYRLHRDLMMQEGRISELKKEFTGYLSKNVPASSKKTESIAPVQMKSEDGPLYEKYKSDLVDSLKKKINSIVSEKPLQGGTWTVRSVRFLSPTFIEAVYEDGHKVSSSLIHASLSDNQYNFRELK